MAGAFKNHMLSMAIAASMAQVNNFMGFKGQGTHPNALSINRVLGSGVRTGGGNSRPYPQPFTGARQWKRRKRQNHGNGRS